MALVYDGTDGLFTRLGALIYMMDAVRAHQTNIKTLFANVQGEYSANDRYMIDQLSGALEARIAEAGGILSDVRAAAEKTLVEMSFAVASTSTTNAMRAKQVQDALVWLIRQMDADSETIDGTTITKSALSVGGSNTGNGTFAYAFYAPNIMLGSTDDWPNIRTEMLEARCTNDAQNGALASGAEVFEIRGQPAYDGLDYRFPAGSGTIMRISSCSSSIDAGIRGQNIGTNCDLEDWTSNVPDRFAVVSGTAGTDFIKETTTVNRGSAALKCAATSTVFKLRQPFGSAAGSVGVLTPDKPYLLSFSARKDATATGQIRVSLQDSAGSIIDGGNFSVSQSVAALTTSFQIFSLAWRTPRVLPSTVYLTIETTTGVAVAAAYIDDITISEMIPIAPGGASIAIVAGGTNWLADDSARYSFTNNGEGAFATAFDRLFDMYGKGLSLPANYAGAETILDSLIA